ncbi:MAG: biotin synthase BioB [Verrucomicrobiota bacterium]|nr:biotin synthase BioB [Verrucomicrobiota bacterium]MEE2813719.1 biotin synthase BioB [Verrucomicrobiota bacterium]
MIAAEVDAKTTDVPARITSLGKRVLDGGRIDREEAMFLFKLENSADIHTLLSWGNRIREHYKGNKIHLCSIVNAKAGACSENCSFCSQSAAFQTDSPKYGFVDPEPVADAGEEANRNGVTAVGLVAAWRGLKEGPMLDEVCDRIREMKEQGQTRPDASLGLIESQEVANRLKEAGLECYGHNLESSKRFFPEHCTTHTYEDRINTIGYLKKAGIKICSGGIIGMGETREDRCDLAMSLREIDASVVPVNILNPIEGTPLAEQDPLPPLEILKTIACFRFIMPTKEIMIAGGRTVNLRDLQCMVFQAGASALMVGNYLTTLNQPVEQDLQMLRDLGLDPDWEEFDESEAGGCGEKDSCDTSGATETTETVTA